MLSDIIWITIQSMDHTFIKLCICELYKRQEDHEQEMEATTERNMMGFNKSDAPFLSQLAQEFEVDEDYISPEDWVRASRMLRKYCRQLSTIEIVAQYIG